MILTRLTTWRARPTSCKRRTLRSAIPLGWVLYKRGDYQQALPILQESAGKATDNPEIQFHLGMTAYMMGQTDLARVGPAKSRQRSQRFPGQGRE